MSLLVSEKQDDWQKWAISHSLRLTNRDVPEILSALQPYSPTTLQPYPALPFR